MARFLVTGGAGFIGSNFVRKLALNGDASQIVVLDALTYAGNPASIQDLVDSGTVRFVRGDINDQQRVESLFAELRPEYIINFAAETHVDRSVTGPRPFVSTNVAGTLNLLECARCQLNTQKSEGREPTLKKFVHISTDEVYGDLPIDSRRPNDEMTRILGREVYEYGDEAFREATPLRPSSPYSASKASADFLVLSYFRTFGMPVCITRCSNNYGPRQFPEKLIPLVVNNLVENRPIPVYGRGLNVRDWIHVDDHCEGVLATALHGRAGEIYNFGGYGEMQNIDLVRLIIDETARLLDRHIDAEKVIEYVADRPGHDRRYAIDARKAISKLGWRPRVPLDSGLRQTVKWYIDNRLWVENIVNGSYREYYKQMYSNRS